MNNEVLINDSPYVWLLDNGHGEDTPGKRSPVWKDGIQLLEYKFNRKIVLLLSQFLCSSHFNYKILVPEDNDITLGERTRRANVFAKANPNKKCVLISIHGNAFGNEKASGIEVFTTPGQTKSDEYANVFYKYLQKLGWKMRPDLSDGDTDKEERFYILQATSMPALLTESGFYTNEMECKKMMDINWQIRIAAAHFNAIKEIEDVKV